MPKLFDIKLPGECKSLPEGFFSAVDVWINKPHVVNKRLCGATVTEVQDVDTAAVGRLLDSSHTHDDDDELLSFLTAGPSSGAKESLWSYCVRTFIPKVNCYGSTRHKEIVLKGRFYLL